MLTWKYCQLKLLRMRIYDTTNLFADVETFADLRLEKLGCYCIFNALLYLCAYYLNNRQ